MSCTSTTKVNYTHNLLIVSEIFMKPKLTKSVWSTVLRCHNSRIIYESLMRLELTWSDHTHKHAHTCACIHIHISSLQEHVATKQYLPIWLRFNVCMLSKSNSPLLLFRRDAVKVFPLSSIIFKYCYSLFITNFYYGTQQLDRTISRYKRNIEIFNAQQKFSKAIVQDIYIMCDFH